MQPAWSYSRFNAVAYNVTGGLNLSLGSVYIPPLPMQAAASEPHPPASSGFSTPAVLRLINSSTESTGDPNILIFSNDDDVSGWNTVLVLSTSKDAGKAAATWKLFNSALGAAAWKSSLHSVEHTGCETDALGVSPAYIVPAALDSVTGFWFAQLLDTVFSTTSAAAATLACVAMNFSVVSGTRKYLSGESRLAPRACSGHLCSLTCFVCSVQGLPKQQSGYRQQPAHCIRVRESVFLRLSCRIILSQRVAVFHSGRSSCRRQLVRQSFRSISLLHCRFRAFSFHLQTCLLPTPCF